MKYAISIISFAFVSAVVLEFMLNKSLRRKNVVKESALADKEKALGVREGSLAIKEKALALKEKALALKEKAGEIIKEGVGKTVKTLQEIADIGAWKIREDFKVLH
jgi:hypothetical protein